MTITELSIKRPSLVVVVFAALAVIGLYSFSLLKYELLPKITPPFVTITTVYPGASPNEVQNTVSKVIEDAVSGIDKVSAVNTTSSEGASFVSIEFDQSADVNVALQDVQRKVNEVAATLPEGAKTPTVTKFALDELPVLRMGVTSSLPSRQFYQLLKDRIQPRLSELAGVAQVTLLGGEEREIRINIDQEKLRSYGLSVLQVVQAIKTSNLDFPAGTVDEGTNQYVVRLSGKFSSLDEIRNLVVSQTRDGGTITVGDVAEVEDGMKERTTINRINGMTSVGVLVQKQSDANSVDVSSIVRAELPKIEADYGNIHLKFDIAEDGSTFTKDAADAVEHDLLLAILLVAVVMLAFLHSIRNSVIVMIAIPASMISTFIAMYAFGLTLNLMTLLGLSLVVGILVDDSIVVLENIYRHLEMGQDKTNAAIRGRNEIGFAALSITLVDVVVFVPLSLVSGLVGNIMREFALTVVFSTLMSLFVSFTVTPMLASRFARLEHLTRHSILGAFGAWFESQYQKLTAFYLRTLRWSLAHRGKVAALTVGLFVAAVALVPLGFIGFEFIAVADRGEFTVTIETPPGSTVDNTNYATQQVEKIISGIPEVRKMFVTVGMSSEGLIGQTMNNAAQLNVTLSPKEERSRSTDDIAEEIERKASAMPGVKVRVDPIGIFGTANQTPIQLLVSGTNYDEVRVAAERVADIVKKIPGTADVRLSSEEGNPETRIELDRQKMALLGVNLADVGSTLRVAFSGDEDSKYREGATDYDMRIVLDKFDRSKTADVGDLTVMNRLGQLVQVKQFADIYQSTGPTKLQRRDRNFAVTVFSQAVGRPSGSIGQDIQKSLANALPPGISISYLGDLKNQSDAFGDLGLALLAAIIFMYMIMVALYDSYVYPFVVMFSVPVAMVGALLALALTMKALSIFSILGIIMLVGLVGKNAILLVDRTNQMKQEKGLSTYEALVEAGETRLRPILMTTVAMVFGMLPIAMSTSSGSEWKSGLAWAIIGGLISSLLLTLVLVPVVYTKVDEWKETVPAFLHRLRSRFGSAIRSEQPATEQHDLVAIAGKSKEITGMVHVGNETSK
jgi:hydrophobic/amphiphilic exporter-1 (mainly G- bacteria), HAE1 family